MAYSGLKMGTFHLLGTPNAPGSFFGKCNIDPFFDSFLVPKHPIFKAFWDFRGAKGPPQVQNVPKTLVLSLHMV